MNELTTPQQIPPQSTHSGEQLRDLRLKINPLDEMKIARIVVEVTAALYGFDVSDILGEYRDKRLNFARSMICYVLADKTELTNKQIGHLLGGRDASTISDATEASKARPDLFMWAADRVWQSALAAFPVKQTKCLCCDGDGWVLVPA